MRGGRTHDRDGDGSSGELREREKNVTMNKTKRRNIMADKKPNILILWGDDIGCGTSATTAAA